MHQAVGQLSVIGEQQQTGGVDIETPDGYPAAIAQARQILKNGVPPFRIAAAGHLTHRFVVHQNPTAMAVLDAGLTDHVAIDTNDIGGTDTIAKRGQFAVDGDAPFADPALDLAARAEAGTGQYLLQLFTHL